MREFGTRDASAHYTLRPSAYAIVARADGCIAVVRTPQGVFLPGGGREAGETAEEAAAREVMEECGLRVEVGTLRCEATELVCSQPEATHFEIQSSFFDATVLSTGDAPVETDHVLEWWDPVSAREGMARESHAWAVGEVRVAGRPLNDNDS